jgi:hypothetical protein
MHPIKIFKFINPTLIDFKKMVPPKQYRAKSLNKLNHLRTPRAVLSPPRLPA